MFRLFRITGWDEPMLVGIYSTFEEAANAAEEKSLDEDDGPSEDHWLISQPDGTLWMVDGGAWSELLP